MGMNLSAPFRDIDRPIPVHSDPLKIYNVALLLLFCTSRPSDSRDPSFFPWYCETSDHSSTSNQPFNNDSTDVPPVNKDSSRLCSRLHALPSTSWLLWGWSGFKEGWPNWNKPFEKLQVHLKVQVCKPLLLALKGTLWMPTASSWIISRNILNPPKTSLVDKWNHGSPVFRL